MTVAPVDTEIETLLACLHGQRRHVLGIVDGLSDAELRRPVLPSGWSCLGLIQHLTHDVELFWFRAVADGDPAAIAALPETDDAWQVGDGVPAQAVLDAYRRQIELADAAVRTLRADAPPAWWPDGQFGDWRLGDLREILLHVITETACHAGHLDAARELIDGRRWLVQS
ncbi:hypothetical protein CS0771_56480 [Catellatospora sp. IY07-71]|uniref:DinB family protein n=1 Tax=Catellatospora sp. IY07-71 TaxID=2728827 RepID=UPI001BB3D135|nr:DinB family protein [Catellatospora sp. IY07-71]BCJ76104.1 hypothetical protein CS0771_56480 [Catellatospora sp. IY07-71]